MQHTVFVTGASGEIGSAVARRFAQAGYPVALHGFRRPERAEALALELKKQGFSAAAVYGDLTEEREVRRILAEIGSALGPVEILVNNAGIALPQQLLTDCAPEDWDRVFAADVRSAYLCARAVLPGMVSAKKGSIVNISSMWGVTGGSCEVPYSAAKAALIGFTKSLAKEVAPSGIRVNCVAPGFILTGMNAHLSPEDVEAFRLDTPLQTLGTPEDVAEAVAFLAGDAARFITGQVLCCDGGVCI